MKFLIFSDSHGSSYHMKKTLLRLSPHIGGVIHLGDGTEEFDALSRLPGMEKLLFLSVCGNGEQYRLPASLRPPPHRILEIEGVRVFLTHGHSQGVSWGTESLAQTALANSCSIALHGHTHIASHTIEHLPAGDVEILCPGSIAQPRDTSPSYGMMDLLGGKALVWFEQIH